MNSFHQKLLLFAIWILLWTFQVHSSTPQTASMRQRYQQWMSEHSKIHSNSIQSQQRFQIFKQNVEYIDAFNSAGNKSYTLGLNQFTDLTNEERIARFTGANPPRLWNSTASYKQHRCVAKKRPLPKSWDWRAKGAVTPVKTQTCGNCWVFAGVAQVESVNFIATGKLNVLSEQEIMDCDDLPGKGGCQGGWVQEVYEYVRHYSLTTQSQYPNNTPNKPTNEKCNISKKSKNGFPRVTKFVNMRAFISDEELMEAVMKQPVAVGIDMSSPALGGYKSGVFTGPCTFVLNHVMQIVGFGETKEGLKYWILS